MRAALGMFVLLVVLLVSGSAQACSVSRLPSGPGAFFVHELDGGNATVVPVHGRTMGAMCELSNRHGLDGDLFAWVETPRPLSTATWHLHALDLSTGARHVQRGFALGSIEAFGLHEGRVLYYLREHRGEGENDPREFASIDPRTGEKDVLPFPRLDYVSVAVGGPVVTAVARNATMDSLYAYDAVRGEWLAHGVPASALSEDRYLWIRGASAEWVLLDTRDDRSLLHLGTGEQHASPVGDLGPFRALDDDYVYTWRGGEVSRARLPDGDLEPYAQVEGHVLGVEDGRIVTGVYSAPELGTVDPFWWLPHALAWTLGLVGVPGVGIMMWRRRRRA